MKRHFLNEQIMVSRGSLLLGLLVIIATISSSSAMWMIVLAYAIIWAIMGATDWYINRTVWEEIKEQDQTHPWED